MTPLVFAATALAGAAGAVLRYLVGRAAARLSSGFPWAVLAVNVGGSLVGGFVVAGVAGDIRMIVLAGLCGGLTTFSTLSVDTVELVLAGRRRTAVASVALNLGVGLAAVALGWTVGAAVA